MQTGGQQQQPGGDGRMSNTSLSQPSNASKTPTRQKKGARTGTLSISSRQGQSKAVARQVPKDEQISRKIQEIFKKRELDMTKVIKQTIFEDRSLYKRNRKDFDGKMQDLEKEKLKITRGRRKNKKEKMKALKANTIERLQIVCKAIRLTYQHYKNNFFESDHYRQIKLMEIQIAEKNKLEQSKATKKKSKKELKPDQNEEQAQMALSSTVSGDISKVELSENQSTEGLKTFSDVTGTNKKPSNIAYSGKKFRQQLQSFFESPFKEDKRFALQYMAFLARDKIDESEDTVNSLFYKNVSQILMKSTRDKDEIRLKYKAFEIISNMVQSKSHRQKLAHNDYFAQVFDKMAPLADSKDQSDMDILEKLSWLATLISFHEDMFDQIIKINLLQFVIKISDSSYPSTIRSNAVLAISLLTYNEKLFDQIIEQGVIDLIMQLCRDKDQDVVVKQFSTLALVHFALNRKSIKILIEKGVLNLFDAFGNSGSEQNNEVIQTNVAWIFLALCNNDITGKQMLEQGITRDMFLVSCNPNYQQIRHLVITGFAELGRCIEQPKQVSNYDNIQQRIKETAIVGMHEHLTTDAQSNIELLIVFSTSDDIKHQRTSYWALKDYILLQHENLIDDISSIIQAFINGCLSSEEIIQAECAAGLSFIVTHHLVYESHFNPNISSGRISIPQTVEAEKVLEHLKNKPVEYVLDAIMYLSGSESKQIRTTAFSTLSSLSKYSSQCESVMVQIQRDIEIPQPLTSKDYLGFLQKRLQEQKDIFHGQMKDAEKEEGFSGLYSLLRLAQEPSKEEIEDATDKYIQFIEQEYDSANSSHIANERYFIKVFMALKHTKDPAILRKLLQVIKFYIDQNDSPCQQEIISPHTILWMLEIMEHQRNEKLLCCLTSSTLLNIVSKHEIHFDYQEVAIIKKFNLALQNIDVFVHQDDNDDHLSGADDITSRFQAGSQYQAESRQHIIDHEAYDADGDSYLRKDNMTTQIMDQTIGKNLDSVDRLQMNATEPEIKQQLITQDGQDVTQQSENLQIGSQMLNEEQEEEAVPHDGGGAPAEGAPEEATLEEAALESGAQETGVQEQTKPVLDKKKSRQSAVSSQKTESAATKKQQSGGHEQRQSSEPERKPSSEIVHGQEDVKLIDEKSSQQQISEAAATSEASPMPYRERVTLKLGGFAEAADEPGAFDKIVKESEESDHRAESPSYIDTRKRQNKIKELLEQQIKQNFIRPIQTEIVAASRPDQPQSDKKSSINQSIKNENQLQIGGARKNASYFKANLSTRDDPNQNAKSNAEKKRESIDTEKLEYVDIEKLEPTDTETIENVLRDSLIKSFMVIFTNEQSQHLLLNKDLIDIAFNCLEFCSEITLAAKRHVARLISIIFKFPQVQQRLMAQEVVKGICELLQQTKHMDIIQNTIKACTYISMNYDFIAQPEFSLDILKALMMLLPQLNVNLVDKELEFNTILTIKNILNGDKQNKLYFLDYGGTKQLNEIILASQDVRLIELCAKAIAEQASYKKVMRKILAELKPTQQLILVIKKCLEISDCWNQEAADFNQFEQENNKNMVHSSPGLLEDPSSKGTVEQHQNVDGEGTKDGELNAVQDVAQSQNVLSNAGLDLENEEASQTNDSHKIEIPEFMKNDLEQLNITQKLSEGLKMEEQPRIRKRGRIRDATYYIVARAIRFGVDTSHLLVECDLISRVISDLQFDNENQFMFQNILLIFSNLTQTKHDHDAIVTLVGQHFTIIIDKVYEMKDRDRRVSLLKALIELILKASVKLASNKRLFQKVFDVARDQRSEDTMVENIIWFATSLCEDAIFHANFDELVGNILSNDIIEIIATQLQGSNERIILQTLKLVAKLANVSEFRYQLMSRGDILARLKAISEQIDEIPKYKLEIETNLCICLDQITKINDVELNADLGTSYQQQQLQSFKIFNRYLIMQALSRPYKLRRLDDPEDPELASDPEDDKQAPNDYQEQLQKASDKQPSQHELSSQAMRQSQGIQDSSHSLTKEQREKMMGINNFIRQVSPNNMNFDVECLDDVEMQENDNEMVENIVCTIDNLASDVSIHGELLQNGVVDVVARFIELFLSSAQEENSMGVNELREGLDLSVMPTGSLKLIKAVTSLMMKLSQEPQIQMQCLELGMLDMLQTCIESFQDYEVLTWLYIAIGNFAVSGLTSTENVPINNSDHYFNFCAQIRAKAANFGCVQLLMYGSESSPFFRIRRICNEYLSLLQ